MKIKYNTTPPCKFSFYWNTTSEFWMEDCIHLASLSAKFNITFFNLRGLQLLMDTHFKNINISSICNIRSKIRPYCSNTEFGVFNYKSEYILIFENDYLYIMNYKHHLHKEYKAYSNVIDMFANY